MKRLIVLSDIHGNLPALDAVLDDFQTQGTCDACWVLGDLIGYFPWSAEVIARLRKLPTLSCLMGNFDRYVITGYRPTVPLRAPEDWAQMPALLKLREARFRWAVERLSYEDYGFLRDLPTRLAMQVPGYGSVVAIHATPGDDEAFILPTMPDEAIAPYLADLDAHLLLYGHTHIPMDRTVGGVRLVNPGSVGLPLDGDPRASYAVLDMDNPRPFADGPCTVTIRRVAYDIEAMIHEMERLAYPAWERLAHFARRGKRG
jgi:predicted phosphodiesterase